MRTFHHIGLVTDSEKPGEMYFDMLKVWGTNPDDDPNKIEWVRFAPDSPLADTAVAKMPHLLARRRPRRRARGQGRRGCSADGG